MQTAWHPGTSEKQDYLRGLCRQKKFVLAAGPRFSSKTVGCLHAFTEHSWLTPRGNNCIITISQTVGFDSGVWKDLTQVVIPEWIKGNFGMRWVREPYTMGLSKKPTCEITNVKSLEFEDDADDKTLREGGATTTIQLESLKVEEEVELRFKPRRYSCIYVPELSSFRNRNTFTTWTECLRLLGLPSDKHLFLADTNPSDEGEASWIFKVWFELLGAEEGQYDPKEEALKNELGRVDFEIADNIFDTPERIAELISKYSHDPDLYARYIKGEWVTASEDALFYKVYRPLVHEVGELETKGNPDPVVMVPEDNCSELLVGWDLGVSNSAVVIGERFYENRDEKNKDGQMVTKQVACIKYLDELVRTGEVFSMDDFVLEVMFKMEFWEQVIGHPIQWRHWSDRSAFDFREPVTKRYHHQIVFDSSDGKITLEASDKGPGSVLARVDLWKKCLFEERLYFSKSKCPKLILMNKSIKRGTSQVAVIAKGSVHKHPFDAASYMLSSEFPDELQRNVIKKLIQQRRQSETEGRVVAVPL